MTTSRPSVSRALRELAAEQPLPITVAGDCMDPLLRPGASVTLRAKRFYWPGDVVAFRSADGRFRIHRVLGYLPGREGLRLITQGDGVRGPDRPVPLRAVVGRPVGGECSPRLLRVPLRDRLGALARLLALALRRTLGR